jgi:putative FmdB family regulatory protein
MPLYEYDCASCKKVHEIIQKFSDAPLQTCPDCGQAVTKRMSLGSFSLKGSGWYTTDYKRKSSGSASSKGDEASPKTADSASSGSSATSSGATGGATS